MQAGLVKNLSPRGPEWNIIVRLTRIWENKNRDQKMYELGLLFIDQQVYCNNRTRLSCNHLRQPHTHNCSTFQGNMIEGCLPENMIEQFGDRLKEGLVYKLESYIVTAARARYKTVEHAHKIRITQQTKMTEIDPEPEDFPLYAYNAKPFDILAKRVRHTVTLSDVIGVVYKLTDVIPPKKNHDPQRQIYLKNESGRSAIVTLWGEHAESFNAEALHEASFDSNMPMLFMGMVVDNFQGMLAFKSTSATRWLFNPPIPESDALRESLQGERYIVEWDGHETPAAEPTETTLTALASQKTSDIVRKQFNLRIRISSINNPYDWWFYACKSYWKKMIPTANIRNCPDCGGTEEEQRYKLSVSAKDVEASDDGDKVIANFLFFGKQGVALTGREASLLASQVRGRAYYVPPAIANLVGKEYTVTAEVKQETYDADPGHIILKVLRVELINPLPTTLLPSNYSSPATTKNASEPTYAFASTQHQSERDKPLEATPMRDVLDPINSNADEDEASTTNGKKRKGTPTGGQTIKKSSSSKSKGPAKALFSPNQ